MEHSNKGMYGEESRTNNAAESYNARWNRRVGVKHPNFWTLGEKIHEAFIDAQNDMGRLDYNLKITEGRKNKNVLNYYSEGQIIFKGIHF